MHLLQKISPEWSLRLGLGAMYIYSGVDLIRHPTAWYWAVRPLPMPVQNFIHARGLNQYLVLQGIGELVLAFFLLAWFLPRIFPFSAALLTAIEMALIIVLVGVDAVTFRDIGLLGAALALTVMKGRNK
jgi:hypothetical protein